MNYLQNILEEIGFDCFAYSGRAMYGNKCLAIRTDSFNNLFADVILVAAEAEPEVTQIVADAFRSMKTDSLGRDTVVYFPDAKYSDPDEDELNDSNT